MPAPAGTPGLVGLAAAMASKSQKVGFIGGMLDKAGLPGFLAYGVYIGEVCG